MDNGRWTTDNGRRLTVVCQQKSSGFTLVEVLIALVILATALTVSLQAIGTMLEVSKRSQSLQKALENANAFLLELEAGKQQTAITYGGRGSLSDNFYYDFESESVGKYLNKISGTFNHESSNAQMNVLFWANEVSYE